MIIPDGKVFGKLTVITELPRRGTSRVRWFLCRCECGREVNRHLSLLRAMEKRGSASSCRKCTPGNFQVKENATCREGEPGSRRTIREYSTWLGMMHRCYDPKRPEYKYYGGRADRPIGVTPRWHRFENFYADMGPKGDPAYELDRIDNDGDYQPGNCRWTTEVENKNNRRCSVKYDFRGQMLAARQISKITGISDITFRSRVDRFGWDVERAATQPPLPRGQNVTKLKAAIVGSVRHSIAD